MSSPRTGRGSPATLAIAIVCAGALALAGCGSDSSSSSTSSSSDAPAAGDTQGEATGGAAGKKVVFTTCPTSNPNCAALNSTIVDALEAAGVEVTKLENDFDAAAQVQHFNQAIAQQPDAILLEATDPKAVVPSIRKAKAAGVEVVNMDGPADPSVADEIALQILPDNEQLGMFAAQNVIEGLRAEGLKKANVIAITGTKASLITQERMTGFKRELAKAPEYELVAVEDGDWDAVKSGKIAQELFAKYASQGGVQAAYGMADYQAVPIVQAAKQAGLKVGLEEKGLIVTGSNCTKAGVQAVKRGDMYGTATEDPGTQGAETAEWLIKYLSGEDVPKVAILKNDRVTKENVDTFFEQCSVS